MAAIKGRVAVSGASGFVGQALVRALEGAGYDVSPMVRQRSDNPHAIFYDYEGRYIELDKLAACFAVIHLAGRNIMDGLWTSSFKKDLYDSRVKSTRFIAHSLTKIDGPRILLNASACGIYGDRADQKLDESSRVGEGFLAKLCIDWERGTLSAEDAGIRVVNMRFGIVLDKTGGMLKKMMPFFKHGLGAILGNGKQFIPVVTREDLVRMIIFLLEDQTISGPVNCVGYEPTTQLELAQALARLYQHKVHMRVPAWLLRPLGDQMSMVLTSARVYPKVLIEHHFSFNDHKPIEETLKTVLA